MPKKIRTIFVGTPDFGAPSLLRLLKSPDFEIVTVICGEDKKIGRKQILSAPIIKQIALQHGLNVLQPKKIASCQNDIAGLEPDIMIVIAYSQIIPRAILTIPKRGVLNVHGSLLPEYRGASCVQAAILNNNKETGVTIMQMDEGLDTGPIIAQKKISISDSDTGESLYNKLSFLGAEILLPAASDFFYKKIAPHPQDDSRSSYVGLLKKDDGRISLDRPAKEIERQIRAMHSWPGAFLDIKQAGSVSALKIISASLSNTKAKFQKGPLFSVGKQLFLICSDGALEIFRIQAPGKKPMDAKEFINGHTGLIDQ